MKIEAHPELMDILLVEQDDLVEVLVEEVAPAFVVGPPGLLPPPPPPPAPDTSDAAAAQFVGAAGWLGG